MRRTEELLVLHAARLPPPTSAATTRVFEEDDELNRAATLRAQHEYATRAVLVWEIEAADRRAAVEANQQDGPQVQATEAHEEHHEGDEE